MPWWLTAQIGGLTTWSTKSSLECAPSKPTSVVVRTVRPVVRRRMVERPRQHRRAVSHRLVWVGLVALAVIVLATFVIGYWVFVRYERRVLRHVPADTLVALRLDVEQVVLYEPIR